jgi:hypothetical protein
MDSDTFPSGERRSERGVAHKTQASNAVVATVTAFDIATSLVFAHKISRAEKSKFDDSVRDHERLIIDDF